MVTSVRVAYPPAARRFPRGRLGEPAEPWLRNADGGNLAQSLSLSVRVGRTLEGMFLLCFILMRCFFPLVSGEYRHDTVRSRLLVTRVDMESTGQNSPSEGHRIVVQHTVAPSQHLILRFTID